MVQHLAVSFLVLLLPITSTLLLGLNWARAFSSPPPFVVARQRRRGPSLLVSRPTGAGAAVVVKTRVRPVSALPSSAAETVSHGAASKYFQLEEMEDQDNCVSEIFLAPDHTVRLGVTDGPEPTSHSGKWEETVDGEIRVILKRQFEAGRHPTRATDVGEFMYSVDRCLTGEVEMVGGLLGFAGKIHSLDEKVGDMEVGFFEMVDTTQSKLEDEGKK